jgi:hypothetical protein
MSDRLAVFNQGRIEQIGAPAEVYERPLTRFVAGFVGTSNLLRGEAAERILGTSGTFTIRPEKIRLAAPDATVGPDETSATGVVRGVVYLGPDTRYVVTLDAGAELVVTQQNLSTSSTEALAQEGKAVRLVWKRQHNSPSRMGRERWRRNGMRSRRDGARRMRDRVGHVRATCERQRPRAVGGQAAATAAGVRRPARAAPARACRPRARRPRADHQRPRLAGLRRERLDRPDRRLGDRLPDTSGLHGQAQIFGTSDEAYTLFSTNPSSSTSSRRPVTPACDWFAAASSSRQPGPVQELPGHLPGPQEQAIQHRRRLSPTASRMVEARTC